MPEFDGALVRSADNAVLVNLNKPAGSQIRGVGIFASISGATPNRNGLPSNNRVDGYIAVVQDVDKVYIFHGDPATNWTNTANWTELGAGSSVSSDSFSVISVSGQSNVEADGAESTVEFIAGTNINVTTDATNDTVTFATPAELTADITGNAETVTTAAQNTSTSAHFVTFTDTAAGDADIFTDVGFKYKPSANALLLGAIHNPNDGEVINLGASGTAAEFTGNLTGNVTGNADTSTKFAASVNIGDVAFDGSADIDLPGVNTTGNQDTSGQAGTVAALTGLTTDNLAQGSTNVYFPGFGTDSSTALRGDTALLQLGTTSDTALAGDTTTITSAQIEKLGHITGDSQGITAITVKSGSTVITSDEVSEGTSNLFYTDARVSANSDVANNTTKVSFPGFGTTSGTALRGDTTTDSIGEGSSNLYYTETRVTNNTTVADHTSKLAAIKPKVDHISVTQAVDLDDMESDINSNTTTITNIENVLKSAFTGGGAGIYTDSNKGTSNSYLGLTSTAGVFQAGENTRVSISETSPGSIDLFVQAGSTGNESAFKAISVDGSSSKSSADIGLNGAVTVSGDIGGATTVAFTRQATPPTAVAGGLYADTSDNLYFGVS